MGNETDDRLDRPVTLHPLTWLAQGDEVVVGRLDVDSYAVFDADGAALVGRLSAGTTPREAAAWYLETYGQPVDMVDVLDVLDELGFLSAGARPVPVEPRVVRWQRLGQALFSPAAWFCYLLLITGSIVAMARSPQLVPHYDHLFFTGSYTLVELGVFVGQLPFLLVHEAFHALAGRRLGLGSRLAISRRLYFVVFETALDGLVVVPRRQRILPILAGMLADIVVIAILTLVADMTLMPGGALPMAGRLCLALAYGTLLRLIWQLCFYLRTDLYVLFTTMLGCHDLHQVAKGLALNTLRKAFGRRTADESLWHPTDRQVARWYAWLMLAGYLATATMLVIAVLPTSYRFLRGVSERFLDDQATAGGLLDSAVFVGLNLAQLMVIAALILRDRRRRRRAASLPGVVR